MSHDVFIVDAVRTPVGKIGGSLAGVRPDDLAAGVIRSLIERQNTLDPTRIDDVYFGSGNGAGEENRNVARMASLLAGLPPTVPGSTTNRLCGSGLDAVIQASPEIAVGDAELCVAGGVESMTRAPWVVQKPEQGFQRTDQTMFSTTLGWRMVNPRHPKQWTVPLGEGAEILADEFAISREAQDEFAMASHHKAAAAWAAGRFAGEVVAVRGATLSTDESVRGEVSMEALARLKPVFRTDGSVTAGNASPMNDGASAVMLASGTLAASADSTRCVGWSAGRCRGSSRTDTGSARCRRRRPRSTGPASVGEILPSSSSTRRSPPKRWRASNRGRGSTVASSTPTVAPSPSAMQSAAPGPASSPPSPMSCDVSAVAGGWPRCASASAKASPWWSTPIRADRLASGPAAWLTGRRDLVDAASVSVDRGLATIDSDVRAVDVRGIVGAQERSELGHFARFSSASRRRGREHLMQRMVGHIEELSRLGRAEHPRADHVGPHPVSGTLSSEVVGE